MGVNDHSGDPKDRCSVGWGVDNRDRRCVDRIIRIGIICQHGNVHHTSLVDTGLIIDRNGAIVDRSDRQINPSGS